MPQILPFKLIKEFDSQNDLNHYLQKESLAISKSNVKSCTFCKTGLMRIQYGECTALNCNETKMCAYRVRVIHCEYQKRFYLHQAFKHNIATTELLPKKFGITDVVKELIEDIVFNVGITAPKRILIKLGSSQFKLKVDLMPDLSQIQSYIRRRRCLLGENSSVKLIFSLALIH